MNRERRLLARKRPPELGFIQINHDEGGRILNISEGGLCFETFAPVERDRLLRFWFSLDLHERIEANGRLTWVDGQRNVGGLQFLELSPRGRRHLRAHLGAEAITRKQNTEGEDPPVRGNGKGTVKGSAFLAALAKQSMSGLTIQPPSPQAVVAEAPWPVAEDPRRREDFRREELRKAELRKEELSRHAAFAPAAQDLSRSAAPEQASDVGRAGAQLGALNANTFVSLERHRTNGRRQLVRGMILGVVLSVAVGAAYDRYFGRSQANPESAPRAAVPARSSGEVAHASPASSGVTDAAGMSGSLGSADVAQAKARQAPASRLGGEAARAASENSLRNASAKPSAVSSGAVEKAQGAGLTVPKQEDQPKSAKKSPRTLKQLWAAAQAGNSSALVELADHYIQGEGVPVNCNQARVLLLVASEKSNAEAIKKLHALDQTGGCPTK